jgi:hypothetical protein
MDSDFKQRRDLQSIFNPSLNKTLEAPKNKRITIESLNRGNIGHRVHHETAIGFSPMKNTVNELDKASMRFPHQMIQAQSTDNKLSNRKDLKAHEAHLPIEKSGISLKSVA